jgi:hypothetical protein
MQYSTVPSRTQNAVPKGIFSNSSILLLAFASAFFSRLLDTAGAPSVINFVHFATVPFAFAVCITQSGIISRLQRTVTRSLIAGLWLFLIVTLVSAYLNQAGVVNAILSFLILGEPFIFLASMMAVAISHKNLQRLQRWLLAFTILNLALAYIQWPLLIAGAIPTNGMGPSDAVQGVFYISGAGNYVSVSVSLLFGLYFFGQKWLPLILRYALLIGALGQIIISDSKQILIASILSAVLLALINLKDPLKAIRYILAITVFVWAFLWSVQNLEAMSAYNSWARPELYGPDGQFTQLKMAGFNMIPPYYSSPFNWLFGLGPGHTIGRLGGWMLKKYWALLGPLGATKHPVTQEIWDYWLDSGLDSTFFSPLFTWSGIWGDLGVAGVLTYAYMGYLVWRYLCRSALSQFCMLNVLILGSVFTQVEEPGFMLTVSILIGLQWHQEKLKAASKT